MSNELAVQGETQLATTGGLLMPVAHVREALQRRQLIGSFTKNLMIEGVDYGKIPGAGEKKVLLKAGAEKLTSFFGMVPDFQVEEAILNFGDDDTEPLIYYRVRCDLYRDGVKVGSAQASCSSRERKYRYRSEWVNGQKRQIINRDVADVDNTILKMADKRALVAATLIATNVSDHFTQDFGDDEDTVISTATVVQPAPTPDLIKPATLKRLNTIGSKHYGDGWNVKRHQLASKVSGGATESSRELTQEQAEKLIAGITNAMDKAQAKHTGEVIIEDGRLNYDSPAQTPEDVAELEH